MESEQVRAGWRWGLAGLAGVILASDGVVAAVLGAWTLAWACAGDRPRRAVGLGAITGLVWFPLALGWVLPSAVDFGVDHARIAVGFFYLSLAVAPAVAAGLATAAGGGGAAWAGAWGATAGLAWALPVPAGLTVVAAADPAWLWPAAWLGRPAVEALIGLVAAGTPRVRGIALVIWALGAARGSAEPAAPATWTVGVLQPNFDRFAGRMPGTADARRDRLSALVSAASGVDLLVAPETAWPGRVAPLFARARVPLIVGVAGERGNAVYLGGGGREPARRDKRALVPLAERRVFGAGDGVFVPGEASEPWTIGGQRVGLLVCYEDALPASLYEVAGQQPGIVAAPSSDVWLPAAGQALHARVARLAAVELGVPVVRAAISGPSLVVDRRGEVLAEIPASAVASAGAQVVARVGLGAPVWRGARVAPWTASVAMIWVVGLAWSRR